MSSLIGVLVISGCYAEPQPTSDAKRFPALVTHGGLALRVALPRDTITTDDLKPVEVHYYIVNGPELVTFDNNPGSFTLQIEDENGQPLPPSEWNHPLNQLLGPTIIELPARAVVAQVLDLRCIQDGAGYAADPLAAEECLREYELNRAGTYRIIVGYEGPEFLWSSENGRTREIVNWDRRMADTATLVVVPP